MGFYIPSFIQKRILRYALTKLDVLDTADLDLESLGITWGKRSSFELRDVGLRIDKLSAILRLPESVVIREAKIRLVRLTIPADIHASGIIFEAEGVYIDVFVNAAEKNNGTSGLHRRKQRSESAQERSSKSPAGGVESEKIAEGRIPTTADLAQSFVDTESAEEKAQLKAAVAKSYNIDAPTLSESFEYGSEEGYGAPLSLPWFVADFLHGIKARTRASVKDVQVNLSVKIDLSAFGPPAGNNGEVEELKLRISVAGLDMLPVTNADVHPDGMKDPSTGGAPAPGQRSVSVRDIRATLLSDSSVLSFMSGLSGPPSPSATYSTNFKSGGYYDSKTPSSPISSRSAPDTSSSQGADLLPEDPHASTELYHSQISTEEQLLRSATKPQLGSSSGILGSELGESNSGESEMASQEIIHQTSSSRHSSLHDTASEFSGALATSSSQNLRSHGRPPDLATSVTSSASDKVLPKTGSTILQPDSPEAESGDSSPASDMFHSMPSAPQSKQILEDPQHHMHELSDIGVENEEDGEPLEDLTKSRLFSHEEAASMYQSAISQTALGSARYANSTRDNDMNQEPSNEDSSGLTAMDAVAFDAHTDTLALSTEQPAPRAASPSVASNAAIVPADPPTLPQAVPVTALPSDDHPQASNLVESPSNQPQRILSSESSEAGFVAKEFFTIAMITLEYQEVNSLQGRDTSSGDDITSGSPPTKHIPGGFSESMISVDSSAFNLTQSRVPTQTFPESAATGQDLPRQSPVRIKVGEIQFKCDMGLISLAVLSFQQIPSAAPDMAKSDNENTPPAAPDIEVEIERVGLAFVSELKGTWRSTKELTNSKPHVPEQDVLLDLIMGRVSLSQSFSGSTTKRKIAVGTFTFGYKNESIFSFDPSLKMRDSIRDTLSPAGHDITIDLISRPGVAAEVVIMTLPLHVKLNLTRLDETFSWIGGLSGILELSSSVISTATVTDPGYRARQLKSSRPTRNVRFASPNPAPSKPISETNSSPIKVTARIGGLAFDLISSKSIVTLEGTAVKIARRGDAVRINIDRLNLKGPIFPANEGSPAITLTFELVKLVYLQAPDENDLDRLLALLAPSRDYEESAGDILLDTFLRQRRQGTILRANVKSCRGSVERTQDIEAITILFSELKKLAPMAKYIPEDDRPGLLLLSKIESLNFQVETDHALGRINLQTTDTEIGHVSLPSIVLLGVGSLKLLQANKELVGPVVSIGSPSTDDPSSGSNPPMVHARFIGDEMDPTMKIKLWNLRLEYHISTVMAILGLQETATGEVVVAELVDSVAALTGGPPARSGASSTATRKRSEHENPMKFELAFRDSALGLNPRGTLARGLLHLTNVSFLGELPEEGSGDMHGTLAIQKMSLLIVDDSTTLAPTEVTEGAVASGIKQDNDQLQTLKRMGYVSIGEISTASVTVNMISGGKEEKSTVEVVIRDDLIVLETCADSTQTFIAIMNGLQPPMPPNSDLKYRTEVVPVQDMIATLSGDDFAVYEDEANEVDYSTSLDEDGDHLDDDIPENLEFVEGFYNPAGPGKSPLDDDSGAYGASKRKAALPSFHERYHVAPGDVTLDFKDDHFADKGKTENTRRWSSKKNAYEPVSNLEKVVYPFKLSLLDVHLIWNLFDGYDWQKTRDTISQAVAEVENKAADMQARRRRSRSLDEEDEPDPVIEDFLFNSIYIGVGTNQSPRELARNINRNIDDLVSEAESYSTTTGTSMSPSPNRQGRRGSRRSRLRLQRSRHHKMTFELKGLSVDFKTLPPGSGETQSSIDLKVRDLDIFDHVPTSTWKKFATYMHDAGERESGTNMIRIEILNVKPVPDLAASEMIFKATILPLRLHVDQDALDFLTRFFEFKDDRDSGPSSASEAPFIQRAEVNSIPVKLDFKPKRVDYGGLRSGRTTEFMNFMILDSADMVMRHVIIYGVSGFDRLGKTLNDIWMPDIKRNQLPGVLAGLAPVRPLVNVGSGVRDLVVIPMREYRKDGRVIRSIQKGAFAFAKTTTTELAKLGAKLAVGTHTALQNAEEILSPQSAAAATSASSGPLSDSPPEERTVISPYAELPIGVVQGLRGAYRQLERDLLLARDAIVAMPGEVMESGSAQGAAKAVIRTAPTVILRPALGVTKAVGQTLMGAATTLDRDERRRIEEKYKRH